MNPINRNAMAAVLLASAVILLHPQQGWGGTSLFDFGKKPVGPKPPPAVTTKVPKPSLPPPAVQKKGIITTPVVTNCPVGWKQFAADSMSSCMYDLKPGTQYVEMSYGDFAWYQKSADCNEGCLTLVDGYICRLEDFPGDKNTACPEGTGLFLISTNAYRCEQKPPSMAGSKPIPTGQERPPCIDGFEEYIKPGALPEAGVMNCLLKGADWSVENWKKICLAQDSKKVSDFSTPSYYTTWGVKRDVCCAFFQK